MLSAIHITRSNSNKSIKNILSGCMHRLEFFPLPEKHGLYIKNQKDFLKSYNEVSNLLKQSHI